MDSDYESGDNLGIYLQFHYGVITDPLTEKFGMEVFSNFNNRVLERFLRKPIGNASSALDLGCGVGGATFLLSKSFTKVLGIDFSDGFINAAKILLEKRRMPADVRMLGSEFMQGEALIPPGSRPEAVSFKVGDACDLPDQVSGFDCVVALNLLCRTPDPLAILDDFARMIVPGGQLILAMPLSWSESFTPKKKWIKGNPLDFLKERLKTTFDLDDSDDLAFLMRETARKYHWCVSLCTSWTRK
jgi:SAM-dependent methyltransferase